MTIFYFMKLINYTFDFFHVLTIKQVIEVFPVTVCVIRF